jgi:hypothetical protein
MSGILQTLFLGAAAVVSDAYFNLVTLLLNTSSTNGAQNNTFLDSSTNNFTITRNGNTTQGTFTPFSQTGWSNYFNGTSDYLTIGTGVTFGSGAFTIECWFNANAFGTYYTIIGNGGTNSLVLSVDSATSVKIDQINVGSDTYTVSSISLNAWHHLAVVRDSSNNMTVFVDGVRATTGSTTVTKNYSVSTKAVGYVAGGDYWHGYISNLRCVVGTAVYSPTSSTLTVPTTPLTAITNTALLTCQSNRFIDNSTNAYSLTPSGTPSVQAFSPFLPTAAYDTSVVGGSGYFDGTGDYLSLSSTSLNLGANDFTIETWVYATTTARDFVIGSISNAAGLGSWMVMLNDSQPMRFFCRYNTGTVLDYQVGSGTFPTNQWVHLAVTRNGANLRIFQNGVQIGTTNTTLSTFSIDNALTNYYVASSSDPSEFYTGYLSGTRVLIGTALYTTTFTPPTAPPTAITNTTLLLNYTNAGIFDSAAKNDLETVGNAQVSTTQAKWGTTSMAFDGTGDYATTFSSTNFTLRTGDFTVECWFNASGLSGQTVLASTAYPTDQQGFFLGFNGSTVYYLLGDGTWISNPNSNPSTPTISTGTWYHIALVRSGSVFTVYLNGTSISTVTSTVSLTNSNNQLCVGSRGTNNYFNGYIDDLRITLGYARYTANFTPPAAAFPLQ